MSKTMNKKEIEDWIKAFNQRQIERMKEDDYEDYIDNECEGLEEVGNGVWNLLLPKQ